LGSDLSHDKIVSRLTTDFIGRNLLYYPTVTSTMDVARKVASEGACEGTVVVAEEQTAGRGRLGRSWINPRGVMAVSIIFHPEFRYLLRLNMVASMAVCRSVELIPGIKTTIKWPNDVLVGGRKLCGILTENSISGQSVDWSVMGIGINVNFDPAEYSEIANTATSLYTELGGEVSRLDVLTGLLREIESLYLALKSGKPIHEEWQERLETLGKVIKVRSGNLTEEGYAESVDSDGSLLLRRSDGSLARIVAGDVTLRD